MVKCNSNTRFSSIKNKVILSQTDTTVGFLSQNETQLQDIKSRDSSKPFIKVYKNFTTFLYKGNRVPNDKKNLVRRARKTTFIVKNSSFRIVGEYASDSNILRNMEWSYSTSANEAGKKFDREFCESKADIIIENKDGLRENRSSSLYKINSKKIRRLR